MAKNKFKPATTTITQKPTAPPPLTQAEQAKAQELVSTIPGGLAAAVRQGGTLQNLLTEIGRGSTPKVTTHTGGGTIFNPAVQSASQPTSTQLGSKENPHQWGPGGIQGSAPASDYVQVTPPGSSAPVTMTLAEAVKFNQAVQNSMPGASIAVQNKTGTAQTTNTEEDLGIESTLRYTTREPLRDPAAVGKPPGPLAPAGSVTGGATTGLELKSEMNKFSEWLKTTYGNQYGNVRFAGGKLTGFGVKGTGKQAQDKRNAIALDLEKKYAEFAGEGGKYSALFGGAKKGGVKVGLSEPEKTAFPETPTPETSVDTGIAETGKEADVAAGEAGTVLNEQLQELYGLGSQIRDFFETGIGNTKEMFDSLMQEIGKLPEFTKDNQAVEDMITGYKEEAKRNELDKFYDTSRIVNEMYTNLGYAPQTIAGIVSAGASRTLSRNLMDIDSRSEQLRYEALKTASEMSKNKIASMLGITSAVYPKQFNLQDFGTPEWFQSKFAATGGEQLQFALGSYQTKVNQILGQLDLAVKEKAIDNDTYVKIKDMLSQPLIQMPGQFDFGGVLGGLGKLAGGVASFF